MRIHVTHNSKSQSKGIYSTVSAGKGNDVEPSRGKVCRDGLYDLNWTKKYCRPAREESLLKYLAHLLVEMMPEVMDFL